jgi:hypothetical protein
MAEIFLVGIENKFHDDEKKPGHIMNRTYILLRKLNSEDLPLLKLLKPTDYVVHQKV